DGIQLMIATAEDVVLAKLDWARIGGSDRQIEDAASIIRVRTDQLDGTYLTTWVRQLGLEDQWRKALHIAGMEI
ncbi:MAG TPA: hypothetical protein VF541_11625, partial [Longimicrobium sp.]